MMRMAVGLALLRAGDALTPQCYTGLAGANFGPRCGKSAVYTSNEYKEPNCETRVLSGECRENNQDQGHGDCFRDSCRNEENSNYDPNGADCKNDQATCEGYKAGERDADSSMDGTTKYCTWHSFKDKAQKEDSCHTSAPTDACTWFPDRGDCSSGPGNCTGSCGSSTASNTRSTEWDTKRGTDCEERIKSGCLENNDHLGSASRCTDKTTSAGCLAVVNEDGCSEGSCSGNNAERACEERSSADCISGTNCTWQPQCCQWLPPSADPAATCASNGAGTLANVCAYNDGNGPPDKDIVAAGFEYGLFSLADNFTGKCATIASFRKGFGSATSLGSDGADLVGKGCQGTQRWKSLAEHIGHTDTSIDEYCMNWIPDATAMDALKQYSPSYIIEKAEEGQFGAVFPGLKNLLFIVTAKPAYGKCLFFADEAKYGAAVCTCDAKECNGKSALNLIVDKATGPMRLLQFIDGSLVSDIAAVNAIVPDILDAQGNINPAKVNDVTEAKVDQIMAVAGMSDKTNKAELWGLVQDYQKILQKQDAYKDSLPAAVKALKIDASKVAAANAAAGKPLYQEDGTPNMVVLESLPEDKMQAVADATGLTATAVASGKDGAMGLIADLAHHASFGCAGVVALAVLASLMAP